MKQCLDFNKKFYLPQVKRDLVSRIINFVPELLKDLRFQETRKYQENLKVGWKKSPVIQISKFCGTFHVSLFSLLCIINFLVIVGLNRNFIEITLRHGCSPVNLLHISRAPYPKNTSKGLLLQLFLTFQEKQIPSLGKVMSKTIKVYTEAYLGSS